MSIARLNNVFSVPVPDAINLSQAQQHLLPGQLAITYLKTAKSLYIFSLSSEQALVKSVPMDAQFEALLSSGVDLLHTPDAFSLAQLQQFASYLLPDFSAFPDANELLITDTQSLFSFPFSALPLPSGTGTYESLISRYAIRTIPSLSIYFMDKPAPVISRTTELAIFADPVFDNLDLITTETLPVNTLSLRGWSDTLAPLPYSAEEARKISTLLTGPTLSFTGTQATRANLSSEPVRNARILHIATHGYFRSPNDDNVGLALSTVDESGNSDPGFITLTELFGYSFNNELVVISGCDTAMGKEQAGVGFNSLSRGFLAQGVKHVISTLWPVSDRASAEFMATFYGFLTSEEDVARALQMTQQVLSRHPDYRNPYYWATYIMTSVSPDSGIQLSSTRTAGSN